MKPHCGAACVPPKHASRLRARRANPPIDGLWTRPYGPPPNWARFLRAPPVWTIFMPLTDLLAPQAVVPALRVNSKKQALQELAARAAGVCGRRERQVLEVLMQPEPLRSSRLGSGTPPPHVAPSTPHPPLS